MGISKVGHTFPVLSFAANPVTSLDVRCYVLALSKKDIEAFFGVAVANMMVEPRYNIAPTTKIPVVRTMEGKQELIEMRWGLIPFWAKPDSKLPLMINARAETVITKPAFRSAFKHRRCLVPASGYYEWLNTGAGKQPYYITRKDREPIAFAGLWEYSPEGKEGPPSVTIVTTSSNPDTARIHDRMPVILESAMRDAWMSNDLNLAEELMKPSTTGTLEARPVSTQVNNIRNQGAKLLGPINPL